MPKLVVLYPQPADAAEFDKAYVEEHQPLVRAQLPGLRRFEAARVVGDAPYYWMAELTFDTLDALKAATSSDGGVRLAGHARQISTGGAPLMFVVEDSK